MEMQLEKRLASVGAFGISDAGKSLLPDGMLAIDPGDHESVLAIFAAIPADILAFAIADWLRDED